MERLIKDVLHEKAEEMHVSPGSWQKVRGALPLRPSLRSRLWGAVNLAAAAAVLAGLIFTAARFGPATAPAKQQARVSGIVTEYPVAKAAEVGEDLASLRARLTGPAKELAETSLAKLKQNRLNGHNQVLERFGMKLVETAPGGPYDLYKGAERLDGGFTFLDVITVNARGDDFVFMTFESKNNKVTRFVVVQAGGVRDWPWAEAGASWFHPPVYAGDDLVWVKVGATDQEFQIRKGLQSFAYTVPEDGGIEPSVRRLGAYDGHWVLEVNGALYVDGVAQNARLGADSIFDWRLVGGKPFFFIRKSGQVKISYADNVLEPTYERVFSYLPGQTLNHTDDALGFYALRDGTWYYVILAP